MDADESGDAGDGADDGELPASNGDAVPNVKLSMYQLSVSVRGAGDDDLDDVAAAARDLMDYLSEKSKELEERPDDRGLG